MNTPKDSNWLTGSGVEIEFNILCEKVLKSVSSGSKIFIGTDSFIANRKINFATAICLHGGNGPTHYYFTKNTLSKKMFPALVSRITEEVRRSVELAEIISSDLGISNNNIELHLDVSPYNTKNGTAKFSEMLKSYAQGAGFNCRVKPDAWASQTVADKHSK